MSDVLLTFIKVIVGVLLLPVVVACTKVFEAHFSFYPSVYQDYFIWGAGGFVLLFLFIYQFWGIYESGQKIVSGAFKFLHPFHTIFSNLVSFYLVFVLIVFYLLSLLLGKNLDSMGFILAGGFIFAMHIILTALELQEQEKTPFKPNGFFWMTLVFICTVFLMVFFLDVINGKILIGKFFGSVVEQSKDLYAISFKRIFFFK